MSLKRRGSSSLFSPVTPSVISAFFLSISSNVFISAEPSESRLREGEGKKRVKALCGC